MIAEIKYHITKMFQSQNKIVTISYFIVFSKNVSKKHDFAYRMTRQA